MNKYIVTHELSNGRRCGNAIIISDHYVNTIKVYTDLWNEARKDFPELTSNQVACHIVLKSGWCKGRPLITFRVLPDTKKNDWCSIEGYLVDVEY